MWGGGIHNINNEATNGGTNRVSLGRVVDDGHTFEYPYNRYTF